MLSILFMLSMMVFFSHYYFNEYILKRRAKKGLDKKAK